MLIMKVKAYTDKCLGNWREKSLGSQLEEIGLKPQDCDSWLTLFKGEKSV